MSYWRIDSLEKLLEIAKETEDQTTLTQNYLKYLETKLRLMKEAYDQGFKAGSQSLEKEKSQ